MNSITMNLVFILITYPFGGLLLGLLFWLLWIVGIIEIKGLKNLPLWGGKVLLVSNHPSLLEPVLLVALFVFQYALRPFRWGPWTMADNFNYVERWWPLSIPIKPKLLCIDRTEGADNTDETTKAFGILKKGGNVIIFAEGGRSWKGENHIWSDRGQFIRPLLPGFAVLAKTKGVRVLPVWFQRNGWWITVNIGEPMTFTAKQKREEITDKTQKVLLSLGDQVAW